MRQSAATGSFFGGVELGAAIVKKGLCQDQFSPEERQIAAFLEGLFLEPQPPPDPALSDWGICMSLFRRTPVCSRPEMGGFSRRPRCIRGEGDPGQDQKPRA